MKIFEIRASIEKLKLENEHLQDELKLLELRNEARKKNGIQSKKAESMAEQAGKISFYPDNLSRKIRTILEDIAEIDVENSRISQEIDKHRATLGGVNAAQFNNSAIDKQVRVLENRLEKVIFY